MGEPHKNFKKSREPNENCIWKPRGLEFGSRGPRTTTSSDESEVTQRFGLSHPTPAPPTTTTDEPDAPTDLLLGIIPLAFFLLAASSLFGLNKPQASSFSYSFSSYSESVYRNEDGKVETRSDSRFSTNIPGLAERMAQEDAARRVFPMEKQ